MFAIKTDGTGWRSIDQDSEIYEGEVVSDIQPEAINLTEIPKNQFTSLEFLDRFTETEQLAVVQATMVSAEVKLWYDRMLAASFVDITDPRTEGGIDALIGAGLLEADRKEALLAPEMVQS